MTDSADIDETPPKPTLKSAADRLQAAIGALETSLDPMLARLGSLEASAKEAEVFSEDRAQLAAKIDDMTARAKSRDAEIAAREAEFRDLSETTTRELDAAIAQMRQALSAESGV